jgi:hypothetical protein
MRTLTHHLTNFLRSPDEPAAAEPVVETVEAVAAEAAPEPAAEPAAEPIAEPAPAPKSDGVPRWALERIGEETSKRQAAEEQSRQQSARVREYEEIVKRLQADPKATPPAAEQRPAPAADQSAVEQEAARIVFQRDMQSVSNAGATQYGQGWTDAVAALNACGANSVDFVANVMEIDQAKAHEIMFQIAQDPAKAASLAKMTPTRRIAEITRMTMAQADPKPEVKTDPKPEVKTEAKPAISKAPAPAPRLAPLAPAPEIDPRTPEGNEKMTDSEWQVWYNKTYVHFKKLA